MKLFSFWRSLATFRVRIALNLKGIVPDEVVDINLMQGKQREDAFRKVNPQMLIPALVDGDGPVLFQSLAIMEYLDETHPQPPLLPKEPRARARVRGLAQIVACDSHPLLVPRVREYLEHELKLDEPTRLKWIHNWIGAGAQGAGGQSRRQQGDRALLPGRRHHHRRHLPGEPGHRREFLQVRPRAVPDRAAHRRHLHAERRLRPRASAAAARRAGMRLEHHRSLRTDVTDMKLASFKANGRASYGAVTGNGGSSISAASCRNIRRCSTCFARRRDRRGARGGERAAGSASERRGDAAADPGARQDHLRRHQLSRPQRRVQGRPGGAEISQPVLPLPDLAGRHRAADRAAEGVGQVRLRGRDRDRDRQGGPPRSARAGARHDRRLHARQRGQRARLAPPRHA